MDLETLLKLAGVQQSQSDCGCGDSPCGCSDTPEPAGMSKFIAMVSPELLGQQPAMEADDEWGNAPDGAAGPAEYEDGISNLGSTSDTSLRRYLKARGANVTMDEQVYPDLTVQSVAESYAAYTAEKAKNPYAIGMAAAMKSAGDKPPLKKSTITKAHNIAKGIDESEELDEISNDLKKNYLDRAKDDVADRKKTISQANKMKNASRKNFHSHSLWMDVAYKNQDKNDSRKAMMAKAKDSMKAKKEEAEIDEAVSNNYLDSLIQANQQEFDKFIATGEIDSTGELYNEMYEYYANEMDPRTRRNFDKQYDYILSKIRSLASIDESELDEAGGIGGGMSGTPFSNAADYAPAVGAGVRGAVNNFTMGGGKYARAAADYGVKNLGALLGMSEPTTFDTELDQELEKDVAAQRDYPLAYDIGDKAATVAQLASGAGALKVLGTSALKAAARGVDDSVVKAAQQAFAKNADANDFELGMRNAFDLTPQMRVPASPLKLTPQMRVPASPLQLTPKMRVPNKESVTESINILKTLAGIK